MTKELKKKTDKDLQKELKEAREELRKFRFGMSGSKSKSGLALRKQIARILTELNER